MSQQFQTVLTLSCYEKALDQMHSETARTVAMRGPGKAQKNYAEQQLHKNKVCTSYLTFKHERKKCIFNTQIVSTVKPRVTRSLFKLKDVKQFQNRLPTSPLVPGMFASNVFDFFLALPSGLASLQGDHAWD